MTKFENDNTSFKLKYVGFSTWRKLFLIYHNRVNDKKKKVVFDRSSTVPSLFVGNRIKLYTGRKLRSKVITRWMVGFKFGEFTWNRKVAIYKAKQLRKKKKK